MKPAVVFNHQPIGFLQFYRQILDLRAFFAAQGVTGGAVAVMHVANLWHSWVMNLALRSLGATTLSLENLDEVQALDGLDIGWIVTSEAEGERGRLPVEAPQVRVPLEALTSAGAEGEAPPLPEDIADGGHILLTSATTGRYKRIWLDPEREERGWLPYLQAYEHTPELFPPPGDHLTNLLSFGLWTGTGYTSPPLAWLVGHAVLIEQRGQPWRAFDYDGITHTMATPAFLRQIVNAPEGALKRQPEMQLIVAGGGLSARLAQRTRERLTDKIYTMLAATEAGAWAFTPIESDDDLRLYRIQPTRTLEVVDEDGRIVADGELGQLRVRIDDGPQGYYRDEESTSRFFRDGWFYPGDLAIRHADGRISLHGRVTDVISILGEKRPAEPFERGLIERLDVEDACVFSMAGPNGEELHVALQSPEPIPEERLTPALQAVLWGFPRAHVHFVEALPRNHMGKVQRLRLKQMLMARERGATATPLPAAPGGAAT